MITISRIRDGDMIICSLSWLSRYPTLSSVFFHKSRVASCNLENRSFFWSTGWRTYGQFSECFDFAYLLYYAVFNDIWSIHFYLLFALVSFAWFSRACWRGIFPAWTSSNPFPWYRSFMISFVSTIIAWLKPQPPSCYHNSFCPRWLWCCGVVDSSQVTHLGKNSNCCCSCCLFC